MPVTTVVFVPGLTADARLWNPVIAELGDTVEAVIAPTDADSLEGMANDVFASTSDSFVLAGTSMGGYVALEAALRGNPRLIGLILANTSARAAAPTQIDRGQRLIAAAESGDFDGVVETLGLSVGGGRAETEALAAAMARDCGAEKYVRHQRAALSRKDRRAELSDLRVPTLVLAGDEDEITPPSLGNEIATLVGRCEFRTIPNAGHLTSVENPAAMAATIRWWLTHQLASGRTDGEVASTRDERR